MNKHCLTMLLTSLLLAGCATNATREEIERAEIGPCPMPLRAQQIAREFLMASLKDPMSAVISFDNLYKASYRANGFSSPKFAWSMVASVNAKNSYGAYVGAQNYWFYFIQDTWVATGVPTQMWNGSSYQTTYVIEETGGGGYTREQAGLNK